MLALRRLPAGVRQGRDHVSLLGGHAGDLGPSRCYELGQAVRAAVESYPKPARVGILGSGGLSHFAIDEPFDREIIRALKEKDTNALKSLPGNKLNSGNSEIRNWIAAAGAAEHLPLAWVEYVPAYRSPAGTGTGLCFAAWHSWFQGECRFRPLRRARYAAQDDGNWNAVTTVTRVPATAHMRERTSAPQDA